MKAWCVTDKWEIEFGNEIVFAETRGKAISIAMGLDNFMDSSFMDLKAIRTPGYDQYYKPNKKYMDWSNDEDKIILVKNGCHCLPEYVDIEQDCLLCCAKDFCDYFQDYLDEFG